MRLVKFAIIGAAVAVGITYLLSKAEDESFFENLAGQAPVWPDKAKEFAGKAFNNLAGQVKPGL